MKRREFIVKTGTVFAAIGVVGRRAVAEPCAPALRVVGGDSGPIPRCDIGETISDIAANLGPGEFTDMPLEAQNPLTKHNPEISWQTICWYDEVRKEIQYMGAPQQSVSTDHQHYIFDETTNTWRTTGQALFPSTGHIWSSAFDPATGDYFFKRMAGEQHVQWMQRSVEAGRGATNSPWKRTSGHPELAEAPTQKAGMAWHPNLYGGGDGGLAIFSNDRILGWRKSTDSWHDIWVFGGKERYSNMRNGSGIYIPGRDEVILGTGRDGNTLLYVKAGSSGRPGDAGVRGQTPIVISGYDAASAGAVLAHPSDSSRILLLANNTGSKVWDSKDGGLTWRLTTWSHPFGTMKGSSGSANVRCTIAPHGLIAGLTSRSNQSVGPTFRLWRPRV